MILQNKKTKTIFIITLLLYSIFIFIMFFPTRKIFGNEFYSYGVLHGLNSLGIALNSRETFVSIKRLYTLCFALEIANIIFYLIAMFCSLFSKENYKVFDYAIPIPLCVLAFLLEIAFVTRVILMCEITLLFATGITILYYLTIDRYYKAISKSAINEAIIHSDLSERKLSILSKRKFRIILASLFFLFASFLMFAYFPTFPYCMYSYKTIDGISVAHNCTLFELLGRNFEVGEVCLQFKLLFLAFFIFQVFNFVFYLGALLHYCISKKENRKFDILFSCSLLSVLIFLNILFPIYHILVILNHIYVALMILNFISVHERDKIKLYDLK